MKLRNPRIWLPAASLCGVLWLLWLDLERASPGPLTPTHAREPELVQAASCEACHESSSGAVADGCATCHVEIGEDIAKDTGLHGTLAGVDGRDCGHCHKEHFGAEVRLVEDRSWSLAGIANRETFDHAPLDFTLEGRHAELECDECHDNADAPMLARGEARFLGLERACVACHEDVHEGRMARDCASCHGQAHPFAEVAVFVHDRFACDGAHAAADCSRCHEPEGDHSVETLAGFDPPPDERACLDCHESPHTRAFLADLTGAGADGGSAEGCAPCHSAVHGSFPGHLAAMPAAFHEATGFQLAAPHDRAGCTDCHGSVTDRGLEEFAARYPGRGADECVACHDDVHGGQFADFAFARESGCLACHERHAFRPSTFDVADHAKTAFELEGSHAAVACDGCHEQTSPEPRTFRGTPADCATCHGDAHRGKLLLAEEDCAICHEATLFSKIRTDAFDHDRVTSFALEGAHAEAECEACHVPAPPDELGRTFGFAHEVSGQLAGDCATCHADPHQGAFDSEGLPDRVEGKEGCARCHTTESFQDTPEAFDHETWTGYALDGAHASAACDSCHVPSERPDPLGRTFGRIEEVFGRSARDCRTCHDDPHRGAFDLPGLPTEVSGRDGCARCHSTESFHVTREKSFDHGLWTRYPIAAFHESASCTDCHRPTTKSGSERSFGHAKGTSCADCHSDPHVGQFAAGGRTDCARCHLDAGGLGFDHQRDSRFALDANHSALACSACHLPWPIPGGGKAVRYKPLGTTCKDCHGPDHEGGR